MCDSAPKSLGPNATQADVVPYLAKLARAWLSCHGHLAAVSDLLEKQTQALKTVTP